MNSLLVSRNGEQLLLIPLDSFGYVEPFCMADDVRVQAYERNSEAGNNTNCSRWYRSLTENDHIGFTLAEAKQSTPPDVVGQAPTVSEETARRELIEATEEVKAIARKHMVGNRWWIGNPMVCARVCLDGEEMAIVEASRVQLDLVWNSEDDCSIRVLGYDKESSQPIPGAFTHRLSRNEMLEIVFDRA